MLRDERFSSKAKVDRYGRTLPKDAGRKALQRLYRTDNDRDSGAEDVDREEEEVIKELDRLKTKYDPTRDGGFSESSSDESSLEEDEDQSTVKEEVEFGDHTLGGDGDVLKGEISSRIAVVNLDWDNIRAVDLLAVFSSFVPTNGRILKLSVYPSEFGKERMEREEMEGPPEEIFTKSRGSHENGVLEAMKTDDSSDVDEDEKIRKAIIKEDQGEEFDSAKLRQYQLQRLRYYYAVLTCASAAVAEAIYNAVDGTEYLTTANFFDLRFIPDEMDFSDDTPRDECERIPDGYKPNDFVTDALRHSKVKLTWDADDVARKEVQRKAFSGSRADIDENELKAYLASYSSDEDEALLPVTIDPSPSLTVDHTDSAMPDELSQFKASKKETERQKLRALLGLGAEAAPTKNPFQNSGGPVGDMQITFTSGLSTEPNKGLVFETDDREITETTAEVYIRREKERKARKKEKMKAARTDTNAPQDIQVSESEDIVKGIKENEEVGFDDAFFTAPEKDRTKTAAARKEYKQNKRVGRAAAVRISSVQRAELELLVVDDENTHGKVQHFDINEIARAEKVTKRKKTSKLTAREKFALEARATDGFEMNVEDPRFRAVFERPEFAVDPSHPRFKGTEGMKALLEEGRRKRRQEADGGRGDSESGTERREGRKKHKVGDSNTRSHGDDLDKLVDRIKRKIKR